MSRTRGVVVLIAMLQISSCGRPTAPLRLTAEEAAIAGTYVVTLVNGTVPPLGIGTFLGGGQGASVSVTGGTLVLGPDSRTRTSTKLTVNVQYQSFDSGQGLQRVNTSGEGRGSWSYNGSALAFETLAPTIAITGASVSGTTMTFTTSSAGLYGAANPSVVLTLTKQ